MGKIKSKYVCQNCGYETAGYLGKCPECGNWGSFVEEIDSSSAKDTSFLLHFVEKMLILHASCLLKKKRE
jgi:DNA repair protein RadA/Sms